MHSLSMMPQFRAISGDSYLQKTPALECTTVTQLHNDVHLMRERKTQEVGITSVITVVCTRACPHRHSVHSINVRNPSALTNNLNISFTTVNTERSRSGF